MQCPYCEEDYDCTMFDDDDDDGFTCADCFILCEGNDEGDDEA